MTARHPQIRLRAARAGQWIAAGLFCLALFFVGVSRPAAQGVSFGAPPGQDLALQEKLLKVRVTQLARDLLGERLVDVIIQIGYVRTEKKQQRESPQRVKLPGFNRHIEIIGEDNLEIVPDFIRLRQIFVLVSGELPSDPKAIARELRSQGGFDPRKGDWLQVVVIPEGAPREEPEALQASLLKSEQKGQPGRPAEPEEEAAAANGNGKKPGDVAAEEVAEVSRDAESTAYLLRARAAFFKEEYSNALRQILKAIKVEPNNPQAYAMLGSLYYRMNWTNLALKYWEKSLTFDPDNREIEDLLEQIRVSQG